MTPGRRKIGIFGGTFDPPHHGHLAVAAAAVEHGLVDEVWLMVSPENPFKAGKQISPVNIRLEMGRLAVESLPDHLRDKITVSDFETRLPLPTYTVETLRALRRQWPGFDFRLVIGGDNMTAFSRWRDPDEILRDYGLIVYPRPGDECEDLSKMPSGCVILKDVALKPYSSTEVRRCAAAGDIASLREMMPESVARYILENKLYG